VSGEVLPGVGRAGIAEPTQGVGITSVAQVQPDHVWLGKIGLAQVTRAPFAADAPRPRPVDDCHVSCVADVRSKRTRVLT
jgi:hypothetical protein